MALLFQTVWRITVFWIFQSILLNLVREGNYRKYIRFFSGILLIFLILTPLMEWINGGGFAEGLSNLADYQSKKSSLSIDFTLAEKEGTKQMQKQYEELILEEAKERAISYLFYVTDGSVTFGEGMEITGIYLTLSHYETQMEEKEETDTKEVEEIALVEIDRIVYESDSYKQISSLKGEDASLFGTQEKELSKLKKELAFLYGIKEEQIWLSAMD